MGILDGGKNKYSIADIATSLNYGQPTTLIQRRVNKAVNIVMYICIAVLIAAITVCLCLDRYRMAALYLGITLVVPVAMILLIKWVMSQREKTDMSVKASLEDAVEIDGTIKYEPYLFKGGENIMSYVVHFFMDEVEYAVTYAKPIVNSDAAVDLIVSARPDLAVFKDKSFKALYSPKYNDVLILTAQPSVDSEEVR